ncbi:MAG: hypothetical protein ACEPO2_06825 [Pelagibaca sp.]
MSAAMLHLPSAFKACPADGVRAEFGVCRGDPIRHIQDLILGDTFLPKHDAKWVSVTRDGPTQDMFILDRAANLPNQTLSIIAELVFMTTTGQRLDVFAAVSDGDLYFVSDKAFEVRVEYVLIDILYRSETMEPQIAPMQEVQTVHPTFAAPKRRPIATLRLIG